MDGGLGMIAIVGAGLLALVLLFAMLRNKRRTPAEKQRTEQATRDLYAAEEAAEKRDDHNG